MIKGYIYKSFQWYLSDAVYTGHSLDIDLRIPNVYNMYLYIYQLMSSVYIKAVLYI